MMVDCLCHINIINHTIFMVISNFLVAFFVRNDSILYTIYSVD